MKNELADIYENPLMVEKAVDLAMVLFFLILFGEFAASGSKGTNCTFVFGLTGVIFFKLSMVGVAI